jgi:hypothetical protein
LLAETVTALANRPGRSLGVRWGRSSGTFIMAVVSGPLPSTLPLRRRRAGRMALPTAPRPACLYSTQRKWLGANLEGSPAVVDAVPAVEQVPAEQGMVPTTEPRL